MVRVADVISSVTCNLEPQTPSKQLQRGSGAVADRSSRQGQRSSGVTQVHHQRVMPIPLKALGMKMVG